MTDQAFKSFYSTRALSPYEREIWFDFGSSYTVETAYVLNYYGNVNNSEKMGNSAFYITDNPFASISGYTKCSSDFHDGGFKKLTNCIGRYLILRRSGPGMADNRFTINEIRAYSVANLLEGAAVIEAPDPKDPSFSAKNLIEN